MNDSTMEILDKHVSKLFGYKLNTDDVSKNKDTNGICG